MARTTCAPAVHPALAVSGLWAARIERACTYSSVCSCVEQHDTPDQAPMNTRSYGARVVANVRSLQGLARRYCGPLTRASREAGSESHRTPPASPACSTGLLCRSGVPTRHPVCARLAVSAALLRRRCVARPGGAPSPSVLYSASALVEHGPCCTSAWHCQFQTLWIIPWRGGWWTWSLFQWNVALAAAGAEVDRHFSLVPPLYRRSVDGR
jgi:hypothetical protein